MSDDWFYAHNNDRNGPVPFAKLRAMAADGWLAPDDLVWQAGMADWIPARDVDGLFSNALGRVLQRTIAGLKAQPEPVSVERTEEPVPPRIPAKVVKPTGRKTRVNLPEAEWGELSPRHLVAACGGFLAALGIAFTAIAQSRIALAFTLSGNPWTEGKTTVVRQ